MKLLTIIAAATLLSAPAAAQTMPIIIQLSSNDRVTRAPLSVDERLTNVAERACARPRLGNLKGQQLFRACVAEVTAELAARSLTGNEAVVASR